MIAKIQPGDLILYLATPRDALVTRAVGAFQLLFGVGKKAATYSHVAIAAWSPRMQFEAKWPWSGHYRVDEKRAYEVWRLRDLTHQKRAAILADCQAHCYELYALDTLLTFGLVTHRHAMVCSQWAAARYAAGGYRFAKDGHHIVAPDVMTDAGFLQYIGTGGRK